MICFCFAVSLISRKVFLIQFYGVFFNVAIILGSMLILFPLFQMRGKVQKIISKKAKMIRKYSRKLSRMRQIENKQQQNSNNTITTTNNNNNNNNNNPNTINSNNTNNSQNNRNGVANTGKVIQNAFGNTNGENQHVHNHMEGSYSFFLSQDSTTITNTGNKRMQPSSLVNKDSAVRSDTEDTNTVGTGRGGGGGGRNSRLMKLGNTSPSNIVANGMIAMTETFKNKAGQLQNNLSNPGMKQRAPLGSVTSGMDGSTQSNDFLTNFDLIRGESPPTNFDANMQYNINMNNNQMDTTNRSRQASVSIGTADALNGPTISLNGPTMSLNGLNGLNGPTISLNGPTISLGGGPINISIPEMHESDGTNDINDNKKDRTIDIEVVNSKVGQTISIDKSVGKKQQQQEQERYRREKIRINFRKELDILEDLKRGRMKLDFLGLCLLSVVILEGLCCNDCS